MKAVVSSLMVASLCIALALPVVYAEDKPNAQCHVREKKKEKKKKTGACTVKESNGSLWIVLKNGESITLKPGKKNNHFKDQKGKGVKRTYEAGIAVYQWEKKSIRVNTEA